MNAATEAALDEASIGVTPGAVDTLVFSKGFVDGRDDGHDQVG